MPMLEEEPMRDLTYRVRRGDFRIDYFSGTGAGGQYRNKHQNCVRLTHTESGRWGMGL